MFINERNNNFSQRRGEVKTLRIFCFFAILVDASLKNTARVGLSPNWERSVVGRMSLSTMWISPARSAQDYRLPCWRSVAWRWQPQILWSWSSAARRRAMATTRFRLLVHCRWPARCRSRLLTASRRRQGNRLSCSIGALLAALSHPLACQHFPAWLGTRANCTPLVSSLW